MPAHPGRMPSIAGDDDWAYEFAWPGRRTLVRTGGAGAGRRRNRRRRDRALPGTSWSRRATRVHESVAGRADRGLRRGPARPRRAAPPHVSRPRRGAPTRGRQPSSSPTRCTSTAARGSTCPTVERRALLDDLGLAGDHWQVSPTHFGDGGLVAASRDHGLPGLFSRNAGAARTSLAGRTRTGCSWRPRTCAGCSSPAGAPAAAGERGLSAHCCRPCPTARTCAMRATSESASRRRNSAASPLRSRSWHTAAAVRRRALPPPRALGAARARREGRARAEVRATLARAAQRARVAGRRRHSAMPASSTTAPAMMLPVNAPADGAVSSP